MKKGVLGLVIVFMGSLFFTSCSSDNTVLTQFNKRKYTKRFKKSRVKDENHIDEYQYTASANTTETVIETATSDYVVLEEINEEDNTEMLLASTNNEIIIETIETKRDYFKWNKYNREIDMADAMNYNQVDKNNKMKQLNSREVDTWVLVLLSILIPPLAVFLYEGITNNFWLDLILILLFWIPSIIYAFLVIFGGVSIN